MAYLWGWFVELNNARQNNGFGMSPLSYSEILAWSQLTGRELTPSDVRTLKQVDLIIIRQKDE